MNNDNPTMQDKIEAMGIPRHQPVPDPTAPGSHPDLSPVVPLTEARNYAEAAASLSFKATGPAVFFMALGGIFFLATAILLLSGLAWAGSVAKDYAVLVRSYVWLIAVNGILGGLGWIGLGCLLANQQRIITTLLQLRR